MIEGGYIIIAREQLDSGLMNRSPCTVKLWLWLLHKAFWKDGKEIKRGQVLTTIEEMREVCGYWVGARYEKPTKSQIRKCYEALTKNTLISTAKTTRGMLVTIRDYDTYQNPASYEKHSEDSPKNERRSRGAHTIDEEGNKKKRSKNLSASAPHALFVAWWCYAFSVVKDYSYIFQDGKDGKAVQTMLKQLGDVRLLVGRACIFLLTDDKFFQSNVTLSFLMSQLNKIPPPKDVDWIRFRQEGLIPPEGVMLADWKPWEQEDADAIS
jgi:hypothetical protein